MKSRIASLLIRLLASTWRFHVEGQISDGPAVIAFWHGSMLSLWKYFAHAECVGVTSQSKDGDILARLLHDWQYDVIRGSSSQGGKEALDAMVRAASSRRVLVTPDGPRGPAQVMKAGAVICAQRAHVPLVFCTVQCGVSKHFDKSWDNFQLPLPFARIDVEFVDLGIIDAEKNRAQVDAMLDELSHRFAMN